MTKRGFYTIVSANPRSAKDGNAHLCERAALKETLKIAGIILQFAGSLSFLLYGMKMMSDGIQKSAGKSLHRVTGLITNNRFLAVVTGMFVTCVIQSSSATTVMIVSFVNAGILSLEQAIGTIFGANIGTTVTAWIVSLVGFKLKIAVFAVPVFGVGFMLSAAKRLKKESFGQALMGFGLLFLGLEWLGDTIPKLDQNAIQAFMARYAGSGVRDRIAGILAGTIITIILDSSSAVTAIIITMAYNGLLGWEFAAALVLGSNIGTTTDVLFASIGAKANAKRAALVHVMFNVTGSVIVAIFFRPFLAFVDMLTPGTVGDSLVLHITMFHTIFNVSCTLLFLPFVGTIAVFTKKVIRAKEDEIPSRYQLSFEPLGIKENTEARIFYMEREISEMLRVTRRMFNRLYSGLVERSRQFIKEHIEKITEEEEYIDQMREEITKYLLHCYDLPLGESEKESINLFMGVTRDIERMSDECCAFAMLLKKSIERELPFEAEDIAKLTPYIELTGSFLDFIEAHIFSKLTESELAAAADFENKIDETKRALRKIAEQRLEKGANVKAELLYIDLVRDIEKIGDCAFSVSKRLAESETKRA
ncbi:MAG: Na/Pi cotransporter family protein [Spirochaetaceae bacterium]|nr:Na/Pi cotransporter family protein [Spirochaetaceae bacterium]